MSLKKQQGFTIVELLIVIVVIGILAALVITTFTGIQQKSRNTERETDIKALHSRLEAYFAENNRYPTYADFNSSTWRDTNMKGLDREAFKDPRNNSATPYNLATSAGTDVYSYVTIPATCDNTTTDCTGYTLSAAREGTTAFTKTGLNN